MHLQDDLARSLLVQVFALTNQLFTPLLCVLQVRFNGVKHGILRLKFAINGVMAHIRADIRIQQAILAFVDLFLALLKIPVLLFFNKGLVKSGQKVALIISILLLGPSIFFIVLFLHLRFSKYYVALGSPFIL